MPTILLAVAVCLIGAVVIHSATRAFMGKPADNLPGGAVVFVGAMVAASQDPWWLTVPAGLVGAAAGHALSVWCWRQRDGSRTKPAQAS